MYERVAADDCEAMRRRYQNTGTDITDLARAFDTRPRTVEHHVRGECDHDRETCPLCGDGCGSLPSHLRHDCERTQGNGGETA